MTPPDAKAISARNTLFGVALVLLALAWALPDLVLLVGYSVLLAYALLPAVATIERPLGPPGPKIPRGVAAAVVMLGLVTIVGWLLALALPRVAAEAANFAASAPEVLAGLERGLRSHSAANGWQAWMDPLIEGLRSGLQNFSGTAAAWASKRGVEGLGQLLGVALLPILAFYLLAESTEVRKSAMRFVPASAHADLLRIGKAVDRALRGYVRGQAIVCLVMGVTVGSSLALLGSPMALLLGVMVGLAELVPYIGFMVAAVAIALAGLSVDPFHALAAVVIYVVINAVVGALVTPNVMGRYLRMHPFIVTVSILAGTQIFGPAGALIGLPGAAVLQAIVGELTSPLRKAGPDLAVPAGEEERPGAPDPGPHPP